MDELQKDLGEPNFFNDLPDESNIGILKQISILNYYFYFSLSGTGPLL